MSTYCSSLVVADALHTDLENKKKMVYDLIQEALLHIQIDRKDYSNEVCRIHIQILNNHLLQFKVNLVQKYREPLKHVLRLEGEKLTTAGYQVIQHSSDSFYFLLHYNTPQY